MYARMEHRQESGSTALSPMSLEQTRLLHEDLERQEDAMVMRLMVEPRSRTQRLQAQQAIRKALDQYICSARKLRDIYRDDDGLRAAELEAVSAASSGNQAAVYSRFYDRLREIKQYEERFAAKKPHVDAATALREAHAHHEQRMQHNGDGAASSGGSGDGGGDSATAAAATKGSTAAEVLSMFSGEENRGKCLDLNALYLRFLNLPQFERCSYLQYIRRFHSILGELSRPMRKIDAAHYEQYVSDLLEYLKSFHARVYPLVDSGLMYGMIEEEFAKLWDSQRLPGWFAKNGSGSGSMHDEEGEEDDAVADGPESNPLYCKACDKVFAKDTSFSAHLNGKKHKRNAAKLGSSGAEAGSASSSSSSSASRGASGRELALAEFTIQQLTVLMSEHVDMTVEFLEKKQTLTFEERQAEMMDDSEPDESDDSDSDGETFINYKNVPLGWDGKPIPYWLYKLHGLNQEFKCEICGNFTYRGPRDFERHFFEARHAYGMKCLGIPNTKHFQNITSIEDAITLHEKMKRVAQNKDFVPSEHEEVEDADGNVYKKKTYLDLKMQGLI